MAHGASDCADHVLPYFEARYPQDVRPRNAVEAERAWALSEISMSEARAAATAHMAVHAPHAAAYAVGAATYAAAPSDSESAARERDWQYQRRPKHLWP